jgi:hypothetical protein
MGGLIGAGLRARNQPVRSTSIITMTLMNKKGMHMSRIEKIDATLTGIGSLIKSARFSVPLYQRPYAWEESHVQNLYKDLNDAFKDGAEDYFLGTIVTTRGEENRLTIIDGQQRLVTTSVLIAAIRNYFHAKQQQDRAQDIEREYLFKRDIRAQELTPHILLTAEDREFFIARVAATPQPGPLMPSNQAQLRLEKATEIAETFVKGLTETTQKPDDTLLDLLEFITDQAKLVSVTVSNESSAFVIFEVLNDRGLELSVADLLKNFIFRTAGKRVEEAQHAWIQMTSVITEVGSEKDIKTFIRQAWAATNGMIREKELYDAIKKAIRNEAQAVNFSKRLAKSARVFAGLENASSDLWEQYEHPVVESIEVLNELAVTQLRPLLLAVFECFSLEEITKTLPMIVSWTVRFLICGSGGSGTLESAYASTAKKISSKLISTASALFQEMQQIVPDDGTFEHAFSIATVSKPNLAKYYLRVIEAQRSAQDSELIVNPDQDKGRFQV